MVEHEVSIISINEKQQSVRVRLLAMGACASCSSKKICAMGESSNKEWDIYAADLSLYRLGEKAILSISEKTGMKAVLLAYVLPFLCMVAIIFAVFYVSRNELISGLSAICSVVLYFFLLYIFSSKIKKSISYSIRPL